MVYCTALDVRQIIHTSLSDSEITSIIALSDAEINKTLGSQSESDELIKKLSMVISAKTIKGRQPQSSAAGEYKEDSGNIHEVWETTIDRIYTLYRTVHIVSSKYQHIDEDARYTEGT